MESIKNMKKTVIITSYIENSINFNEHITHEDFVICTDGGYDIAVKQQISIDLLLGDFDSINSHLPKDIKIIRFNPEKDFTDLDLALKFAKKANEKHIEILGGIGGRLDHTVANLQLLSRYCDSFDTLSLIDGKNKCFMLTENNGKKITIPAEKDSYLSIFSLSETCKGVTFRGVKYPLYDHTLTQDFPLGVSNEFMENNAELSLDSGRLLIVISKMECSQ